ncbi:MAG TPA: Crp/Fnr family transcriptional regulator [Cellvibrio sp.]
MPSLTTAPIVNRLIESLSPEARQQILYSCEQVELSSGTVLCEPDQPFRYVYFPLTSFITLVTTLRDHQPLEMGLIGNEGMLGATVALGINSAPMRAMVQGSGTALRMTAEQLQQDLQNNAALTSTFNRYLYVLMAQLAQTAACAHFHAIEPRLARWLLMTHDRAHADYFHLTQEFLANMLGVRRSGITVAAGVLQERKLIQYTRGKISILDRAGLEAVACECYEAVTKDYARLFE